MLVYERDARDKVLIHYELEREKQRRPTQLGRRGAVHVGASFSSVNAGRGFHSRAHVGRVADALLSAEGCRRRYVPVCKRPAARHGIAVPWWQRAGWGCWGSCATHHVGRGPTAARVAGIKHQVTDCPAHVAYGVVTV
jgi:hypothetical protein